MTRGPRAFRILLTGFSVLVFVFLMLPLAVIVPLSFSGAEYLEFPPRSLSLRWYESYFGSAQWIDATLLSIGVGLATATLATVLGFPAALFITRCRARVVAMVLDKVLVAPMIIPPVVIAIVTYSLFSRMQAIGSWWALVLAHTLLALPLVVIVLTAGLRALDRSLEQAALGLGAGWGNTYRLIVFPIIRPSLVSAFFFAFMASFDDLIVALFLAGSNMTLPKKMFENIGYQLDPTIAAVCVIQVACILAGGALWLVLQRRRARRIATRDSGLAPGMMS
ncbi:ABC transporter permease [Oceanicella sp. SM1341]|uniref:ABC transporter permease n=1 Tax=Oceanicella sp. SM1341 TaxID=1548889 RepID=UPI000E4816BA|nr:ABC transporter permease [Oceanicella sp. SM1341]